MTHQEAQTIISGVVAKYARRLPDSKQDLEQELWLSYLCWDGEENLEKRLGNAARAFLRVEHLHRKRECAYGSLEHLEQTKEGIACYNDLGPNEELQKALDGLRKQDRDIAWMVSKGFTKKEIAEKLGRSVCWVSNRKKAIFQKLRQELGERNSAS